MVPGKGSVLRAVGIDSGSPWPSGDSRVAPGDFSVVLPARGWAEGQHVQENEPNSAGPGVLCSSACRQGSACCSASSPEPTHPAQAGQGLRYAPRPPRGQEWGVITSATPLWGHGLSGRFQYL